MKLVKPGRGSGPSQTSSGLTGSIIPDGPGSHVLLSAWADRLVQLSADSAECTASAWSAGAGTFLTISSSRGFKLLSRPGLSLKQPLTRSKKPCGVMVGSFLRCNGHFSNSTLTPVNVVQPSYRSTILQWRTKVFKCLVPVDCLLNNLGRNKASDLKLSGEIVKVVI